MFIDLTGQQFNKLQVLRRDGITSSGAAKWLCQCECGSSPVAVSSHKLRRGHTRSCGCLRIAKLRHGQSNTPLYMKWRSIIDRCENPCRWNYANYGGRGITMCSEWRNNVDSFLAWAHDSGYVLGMWIDRIDNNQGYSPSNCRFVDAKQSAKNRRPRRRR